MPALIEQAFVFSGASAIAGKLTEPRPRGSGRLQRLSVTIGHNWTIRRYRSLSVAARLTLGSRAVRGRLFSGEDLEEFRYRVVVLIDHALLERNDGVVSDVDVLRADLRAALGDVAVAQAAFVLEVGKARRRVQRMHLQVGDTHEEARAGELGLLVMVAQHVADVLAQEALDALAKLL